MSGSVRFPRRFPPIGRGLQGRNSPTGSTGGAPGGTGPRSRGSPFASGTIRAPAGTTWASASPGPSSPLALSPFAGRWVEIKGRFQGVPRRSEADAGRKGIGVGRGRRVRGEGQNGRGSRGLAPWCLTRSVTQSPQESAPLSPFPPFLRSSVSKTQPAKVAPPPFSPMRVFTGTYAGVSSPKLLNCPSPYGYSRVCLRVTPPWKSRPSS